MRLLGTVTSPFVRRVRVVAAELGLDLPLVDTRTPEGEAELHRLAPLRKVPALDLGAAALFDSHAIVDHLLAAHGPGPLRPRDPRHAIAENNAISAIDGALEAAIRLFYFRRDGVDPGQFPYMRLEHDRVGRTLAWLDAQLHAGAGWCTPTPGFGVAELAVFTALDWMRVRGGVDLAPHARLVGFLAAHDERPALAATRPPPAWL